MKEPVKRLKSIVSTFFTWTMIAFIFSDNALVAIIFGAGGLLLGAASSAERYTDLLVRGGGFFVMALSILLTDGGWMKDFLFLSLAGIGFGYVLAYAAIKFTGSDFVERNFLVFSGMIVMAALLGSYPDPARGFLALFYILVAAAIVYLVYLVSTYVSVRLNVNAVQDLLPPPESQPKGDAYSRELSRVVRAFVERGDKGPLLVFVLRHSPRGVLDIHLERAVKPLVEYSESPSSPFAPPWVVEKMRNEEKFRRKKLVEKLIKTIESMGGFE
ncbi:hypothetical protein E3E36_02230 [Thermococcus sp. M36]|uniref:hypothetical protein n=1 Tax=Thermococcus sp. M36 TaxID=1638261 RepID=UPI00143AA6BF|nr:hypothetical protein [Thermococcus sp. M36]NJE04984.1 hypothetical protein [Thermococcus sp. M36]